MGDRLPAGVGCEVSLGHVGRVVRAIRQDVVPGLVPRRAAAGHLFVPFVAPLEGRVDVEDHPAIAEAQVVDAVAHGEARVMHGSSGSGPLLAHTRGTVRHARSSRSCHVFWRLRTFPVNSPRRTADFAGVAMQDIASRFREYVWLERKRYGQGLTPAELERWALLKRYLSRRFSPNVSDETADKRRSVRIPTRLTVTFRDDKELRSSLMTNMRLAPPTAGC